MSAMTVREHRARLIAMAVLKWVGQWSEGAASILAKRQVELEKLILEIIP